MDGRAGQAQLSQIGVFEFMYSFKSKKGGAPSTFVPPKDAPKWAIDPTWKPKQSLIMHGYIQID